MIFIVYCYCVLSDCHHSTDSLGIKMAPWMDRLSMTMLICCRSQWSSLVSSTFSCKMENCHYFCKLLLMSYGWRKGKKEEQQSGHICSGITRLHKRLGELQSLQYTSEVDLSESLWLDRASRLACTLPIPYVQDAILNLLYALCDTSSTCTMYEI